MARISINFALCRLSDLCESNEFLTKISSSQLVAGFSDEAPRNSIEEVVKQPFTPLPSTLSAASSGNKSSNMMALLLPALLFFLPTALSQSPLTPILTYAYPKALLGLEAGMFSHSYPTPPKVIFLPGFHSCGTLQIVSVQGLDLEGMEALLVREGEGSLFRDEWDKAQSSTVEDGAREDEILAWAKGWRQSCGKGEENKRVEVIKAELEGEGDAALAGLDVIISTHLSELNKSNRQHQLLVTSGLTSPTLLSLFSLASTSPTNPTPPTPETPSTPPTSPTSPTEPKPRRHRSRFFRMIQMIVFWGVVAFAGYKLFPMAKAWYEKRRDGGVRLPMTTGEAEEDELDLEAE